MAKRRHMTAGTPDTTYAYRVGKSDHPAAGKPLRIILATESPVRVFDWKELEIVDEVLLMDGLEYPRQLPMLNDHDRSEARSVVGSIRNLAVVAGRLEGEAHFASSKEAQEIRQLYEEGHLTDFSIGFQPNEVVRLRNGETTTIRGRTYSGPIRIVTQSQAKEGSAVAVGADEHAKVLREHPALRAYLYPDQCMREKEMDTIRNFCLTRGMPADTPDDEVPAWMEANLRSEAEDPSETPSEEDPQESAEETAKAERQRAAKIADMCARANLSQAQAASYIQSTLSVGDVAEDVLRKSAATRTGRQDDSLGRLAPIESEDDKFSDGCRGALINRCLMGINLDQADRHAQGVYSHHGRDVSTFFRDQTAIEGIAEVKRLVTAPVARNLRNVGLYEMARLFVQRNASRYGGVMTRDVTFGMSRSEVVKEALRADIIYRSDPAYHVTSSFSNVLLDAAKKTLLAAYEEANVTYPLWTRQAPSTVDFKIINRTRLGEIPDPNIVPENDRYGEMNVSDAKESYRVEKYGGIFSISLEAIVNDDLNAISRIPANQGAAMRRKINKVVYAVLTGNAPLSDDVALFHATQHGGNKDANALSIGALNAGWTVMALQQGLSTGVILNIQPRYLLVPPALGYTALQLTGSIADPSNTPATAEDAARPNYNSGVLNVYGPNGSRPLTPIVDACISTSDSATIWYLAAEPSQVDTVEVCFLQGEETPYLERDDGFEVDAVRYKIRQTFGAKAIDYRGLYQGNS